MKWRRNFMNKFKVKFFKIIYRLLGPFLPESYFGVTVFGKKVSLKFGLYIRRYLAEKIIKDCGNNVNIERKASFHSDIKIGNNSGIGFKCHIPSGTVIGDNVMMGPEVVMYNRNHKIDNVNLPMNVQGFDEAKPIKICDDVWIGRRVILLPGTCVGTGSVLGAGTVVSKNIPPYSVVVGNPGKIIKSRLY